MSGSKPHPEALFYHTAANSLKAARHENNEYMLAQLTVTSIVFSAFTLEAFINEEYSRHKETKRFLNRNANTENRWTRLPAYLGSAKGFDEKSDPHRTFVELITVRNDILAHYKPLAGTPNTFFSVVKNVPMAERFFSVVKDMIVTLHTLTAGRTDLPKFLTGHEYLATVTVDFRIPLEFGSSVTS